MKDSIETWSRTIFNQRTTGSLKQVTALVHGLDLHREKHPLSAAATEDDEARGGISLSANVES